MKTLSRFLYWAFAGLFLSGIFAMFFAVRAEQRDGSIANSHGGRLALGIFFLMMSLAAVVFTTRIVIGGELTTETESISKSSRPYSFWISVTCAYCGEALMVILSALYLFGYFN